MRKIFCYTDSLLELFRRDFIRDTQKFFRASKITEAHLDVPFEHKSITWKLIGQTDDKEMICENLTTGGYFGIDRITVQRCLLGEEVAVPKSSYQKMKPVKKIK